MDGSGGPEKSPAALVYPIVELSAAAKPPMEDNLEQRVRQIMADILHVDPARIDDSTSPDTVESWDSANHINLVLALEEEFGIAFDVSEIESMVSFSDIVHGVTAKV